MYKIIIIDDEINIRKEMYEEILSEHFDITFCSNEIKEIKQKMNEDYYDCIILDSTLLSGIESTKMITILNDFNQPIIVVSDKRKFNDSDRANKKIIDGISIRLLMKMRTEINANNEKYTLDDYKALKEDFVQRIRQDIRNAVKYSDELVNDKFSILHISDLQFDDPESNQYDLNLFFVKLTEYISTIPKCPDIVVITGDIVFKGVQAEYRDAGNPILRFLKAIYGDDTDEYKMHLLIVPGNHDFNYSAYLADKNESELKPIDSKENTNDKNYLTPDDFDKFIAPESALFYFRKFAYQLTDNREYFTEPLLVENNLSAPLGIRIIGVSNAGKYHMLDLKEKRYEFDVDEFELEKHFAKKEKMTILLGHISPRQLGYQNICQGVQKQCNKFFREQCANYGECRKWGATEMFMNAYNVILYLYGHQHFFDSDISSDHKRLYIGAGSPSGVNRNEMSFNMIDIVNEGITLRVDVTSNIIGNADAETKKVSKYIYNINKKEWQVVE